MTAAFRMSNNSPRSMDSGPGIVNLQIRAELHGILRSLLLIVLALDRNCAGGRLCRALLHEAGPGSPPYGDHAAGAAIRLAIGRRAGDPAGAIRAAQPVVYSVGSGRGRTDCRAERLHRGLLRLVHPDGTSRNSARATGLRSTASAAKSSRSACCAPSCWRQGTGTMPAIPPDARFRSLTATLSRDITSTSPRPGNGCGMSSMCWFPPEKTRIT